MNLSLRFWDINDLKDSYVIWQQQSSMILKFKN